MKNYIVRKLCQKNLLHDLIFLNYRYFQMNCYNYYYFIIWLFLLYLFLEYFSLYQNYSSFIVIKQFLMIFLSFLLFIGFLINLFFKLWNQMTILKQANFKFLFFRLNNLVFISFRFFKDLKDIIQDHTALQFFLKSFHKLNLVLIFQFL